MTRSLYVATSLLMLGTLFSGQVTAQQKVYQWKDASGRTHYSNTPPASGKYSQRGLVAAPAVPEKPAQPENAQCNQARSNLGILKANTNVRIDTDGDGKPDRLMSPEEHAAQTQNAESIISVSCKTPSKS